MFHRERTFTALLLACLLGAGCFGFGHKKKPVETDNSNAPDKVLYERALDNIKHGRHEVGRLTLQTLINTYPDSDHLADAKLAMADSFFKEGGRANMTQAIAGYKDYIVFFPFLDKAPYAQMQVGMAHYRMMEKPDRDRSEAKAAEDELQTLLQKYPDSPYAKQAEQWLRDVQEMLAEGDYRIGYYYYVKGSHRAAASRLIDLTNRYPLYSRADRALWMLGTIFEKNERKELASQYYARIVRTYPLSDLVPDAKDKLTVANVPIPQPDPQALAWQQKEREIDRGGVGL
ncbi:MAG: outer membrane protein assembly factor BamD, partial [Terriglobales bacterium]